MQLVLDRLEEGLGDVGILVVVDAALLIDIGDFEVETPLAGADGANPLKELIEIVLAETLALLKPFIVKDKSLDEILAQNLGSPDAELSCLPAIHPIAYGDDGVQIVEIYFAGDFAPTFGLNYTKSSYSCYLL